MKTIVIACLAGSVVVPGAAPAPSNGVVSTLSGAYSTNYNSETFRDVPAATRPISMDGFNRDLLDAAVFHATNRRRNEHRLPPLKFDLRVRQAARMHSEAMAKHAFVSHENEVEPGKKTMSDRGRTAGLRPALLAENVASSFARAYSGGREFYTRVENGKKIQSMQPNGPQIPMRSYIDAAEAVVDGWMNSPGHKKNILLPSAEYLGCACEPAAARTEMETLYCTQVFYTPLR